VRARGEERGAVAVEFALVLPLLLLLLFGLVYTGLAYSDHLAVTNAVREGARFGAAVDYTPNPTTWATSVRTRVQDVYFNAGSTLPTADICVKLVDSSGVGVLNAAALGSDCGPEPPAPSNMATGSCAVKVWVRKPAQIDLVVAPTLTFRIGAQSVSYYGRTGGSCTAS
jgi:hypothetical protein